MRKLTDKFNRIHNYLRFSLTDKCNLNCVYCNPVSQKIKQLRNHETLTSEEAYRLIHIFVKEFEFKKIRFTGGEPLARKDIVELISILKPLHDRYGLEIGITTNGTLLLKTLPMLKQSGVTGLNISLDTLHKEKFMKITGKDKIEQVLRSIEAARELGFNPLKINCVVMKGINDNEITDLVDFIKDTDLNIRFIEYMPFSGNSWNEGKFISYHNVKAIIEKKYQLISLENKHGEVANNYLIDGYRGRVSFISAISDHFCNGCNRLRVTSEGTLKLCLFSPKNNEVNLKSYLRNPGFTDMQIAEKIQNMILEKELNHPGINELLRLEKNNMLSIGG